MRSSQLQTWCRLAAAGLAVLVAPSCSGFSGRSERLFDGRSLAGWHGDPNYWSIENGAIVGSSDRKPLSANTFLVREGTYTNFALRLKFRFRNGNSGVQFRSREIEPAVVAGYQADMSNEWNGILYEERGRGFLELTDSVLVNQRVHANQWNDYQIVADRDRVRLTINGLQTVDYLETDPTVPRTGVIALQLHAGEAMRIEYKDIELERLPDGPPPTAGRPAIPPKSVVLTFDDAVKSHLTVVGPLLKRLGFRATFFVTQAWMADTAHFLTWDDVAQLDGFGFEIGNHSWTHDDFGTAAGGRALGRELEQVEAELARVGVPKPVSFAWCGNAFGPEGLAALTSHGYQLARRGMQPEQPYGVIRVGPALDVTRHAPLLIPTTGDAYPQWTMAHFQKVLAAAKPNEIVVLQFHGAPDSVHPWVHTPPDSLRRYLQYLKDNDYHVFALRDLVHFYDWDRLPDDSLSKTRLDGSSPAFASEDSTK